MGKIEVKEDYNLTLSELEYKKIIRLLECLKLHKGGLYVNATLRNHPTLDKALTQYEASAIVKLESNLNSE